MSNNICKLFAFCIVTIFIAFMSGCGLDESEIPRFEKAILESEELSDYITVVNISNDEEHPQTIVDSRVYYYNIFASATNEFRDLSEDEKYHVIKNFTEVINDNITKLGGDFDCGEKNLCLFDSINILDIDSRETFAITGFDKYKDVNSYVMEVSYYDENDKFQIREVTSKGVATQNKFEKERQIKLETPLEIHDKKGQRDGDYVYTSGAIKNVGDQDYSYIKVRVTHLDEDNNVIDTDWTYAVSSEGLRPGEQKYFEIMTKHREGMKRYKFEIMDYQE